jgi:hypothetical protein
MLEKKDIIYDNFDMELYKRIRNARQTRNDLAGEIIYPMFEDLFPENGRIFGHEWEEQKMYDIQKDRYITIQSVHRHWYCGWYKVVLYYTEYLHLGEIKKSHGTLCYENENCTEEIVLENIRENRERFKLVV